MPASKKSISGLSCIFAENMHGFNTPLLEALKKYSCKIYKGNFEAFLSSGQDQSISALGIIKGPRTSLTEQNLENIKRLSTKTSISYVGRNPFKIIDRKYTTDPQNDSHDRRIHLLSQFGKVSLKGLDHSPLSEAVTAYVIRMTASVLSGNKKEISKLSIESGNTFSQRNGHQFTLENASALNFNGLNVGVIGVGDIGTQVAKTFHALGAHVTYLRQSQNTLTDAGSKADSYEELAETLNSAGKDTVLSVHLPYGVKVPLSLFKNVELFLNTSSGSNIDENELISAIETRKIRSAVIDTFQKEGFAFNLNALARHIKNPRIIMTPHIAYCEKGKIIETINHVLSNLDNGL